MVDYFRIVNTVVRASFKSFVSGFIVIISVRCKGQNFSCVPAHNSINVSSCVNMIVLTLQDSKKYSPMNCIRRVWS